MPSRFLRSTENRVCEWCRRLPATANHHVRYRSEGGKDQGYTNASEADGDPQGEVVLICIVCHDAAHRLHSIMHGFCCHTCSSQSFCDAGQYITAQYAHSESPKAL